MKVDCSGQYVNDKGVTKKVTVKSSADLKSLEFTRIPDNRPANPFDVESLRIVKENPMWPVASISAQEDDRPRDGSFTELDLSIYNEVVSPTYHASLTIVSKAYDRMQGKDVETKQDVKMTCTMETQAN